MKTTVFLVLLLCFICSFASAQMAEGDYTITLYSTGKALDADALNVNNDDCKVQLWDKNELGSFTQIWTIKKNRNGYSILLKASGKALDADVGDIRKNGCKIHLWGWDNGNATTQNWTFNQVAALVVLANLPV